MSGKLPATFVEGYHDPELVKKMTYRPLGGETNLEVSILSFGASSIGSAFHETQEAESIEVVKLAVKAGINWIDTSPWYGFGKSEEVLGKALKEIPREAYYLATKCGRYRPETLDMFDFSAERVTRSVEESLKRLGVDYLDCIQIHDPEFAPNAEIIINETLPALHKLKAAGKVKMIGMTGYPMAFQRKCIENSPVKVDTCLSYCHYSLNDTTLLTDMEWLKAAKVGIVNASALSMGLLTNRGPPSWHPATTVQRAACKKAGPLTCEKLGNPEGFDFSYYALLFTLDNTDIPTTLVSTSNLARMQANLDACYVTLKESERAALNEVVEFFKVECEGQVTWEGHEVKAYWQKVSIALAKQTIQAQLYAKSK